MSVLQKFLFVKFRVLSKFLYYFDELTKKQIAMFHLYVKVDK